MQKRLLMIVCMSFAVLCGYAQQKQGSALTPINRGTGKGTVVDHAKISVWYAMNADDVNDVKMYRSISEPLLKTGLRLRNSVKVQSCQTERWN